MLMLLMHYFKWCSKGCLSTFHSSYEFVNIKDKHIVDNGSRWKHWI